MKVEPVTTLINVLIPVPAADTEVLDIPEFKLPSHTGNPPAVVNVGPYITPIPDASPAGYAVYSVRAEEFSKAGGWQGASVSEEALKAQNPSVAIVEQAWKDAHANVGGYGGTAASGTALHAEVAKILKERGYRAEVSVSASGEASRYGKAGSIRLDVYEVRGNDLYIYDFKAGDGRLTATRTKQIKERAQQITNMRGGFDNIKIIEVKE